MSREPALEVGGCPLTLSPLPCRLRAGGRVPHLVRQIPNSTQRLSGFISDSCTYVSSRQLELETDFSLLLSLQLSPVRALCVW
eukprot:7149882-Prymnesium_polylepis.1